MINENGCFNIRSEKTMFLRVLVWEYGNLQGERKKNMTREELTRNIARQLNDLNLDELNEVLSWCEELQAGQKESSTRPKKDRSERK